MSTPSRRTNKEKYEKVDFDISAVSGKGLLEVHVSD
jgi:hypothetical protein